MRALYVHSARDVQVSDGLLTLHQEYNILAILAIPGRDIKFRVLSDDGRTPILADSRMFTTSGQPVPETWTCTVSQDGIVELGPPEWLEPDFWERFFDRDPGAVDAFYRYVRLD